MSKEKKKAELIAVDEEAEKIKSRLLRLNENSVEEIIDETPVRIGAKDDQGGEPDAATREDMRLRSGDPDVGKLIEDSDEYEYEDLEGSWESGRANERELPIGWLWLILGVYLASLIWSLVEISILEKKQALMKAEMEENIQKRIEEKRAAAEQLEVIEEVARNFYDSRSVDEMARYVRHPERVRPLMEDFYSRYPLEFKGLENIIGFQPITLEKSGDFWLVALELEASEATDVVVIEVNGSNEVRFDWETMVCYQPMEWVDLVTDRPGGVTGDFRVYAKRDYLYSHEFADSEEYACYILTGLQNDLPLFGYVSRASEDFMLIEEALKANSGTPTPMILKLHRPEALESKSGVIIQKMVNPLWLYVQPPELEEK